jgi:hypothetical protein
VHVDVNQTGLGVKVETTGGQTALLDDNVHHGSGALQVHGELVGVPAEQLVARVGIDRAQLA